MARTYGAERGLTRFEGFTDAVFAIALTLLIVEIKPPGAPDGPEVGSSLWGAIAEQWREFLALLVSFVAIGVYWLQHHYTGRIYAKSDHVFSVINLAFLLAIVIVPYPIRVWTFHLGTEHGGAASLALAIGLMLPSLAWMAKWFYAMPGRRLMDERLRPDFLEQMTLRYGVATLIQVAAVPLTLVVAPIGVTVALLALLYFLLPQPRPRYVDGQQPHEDQNDRSSPGE